MTMNKGMYKKVTAMLEEVLELVKAAEFELDNEIRWDHEKHAEVKVFPSGVAPDHAQMIMGSKATGALRRRSLDLTRLLADMRKS